MMDKLVQSFWYFLKSVIANECWRRLSDEVKLVDFITCGWFWESLGTTGQWMKPEQVTVSLGITGIRAVLFGVAASSRTLALGSGPTPPPSAWIVGQGDTVAGRTD